MKILLVLNFILLMTVSCSKYDFDKTEKQRNQTKVLKNKVVLLNQDSIARMNSGDYLESDLTLREIDSISINRTIISPKQLNTTVAGPEYTDASGLIHFQIFINDTPSDQHLQHLEATVGSDFVLVGGGAYTYNTDQQGGAFLNESRPDPNLTKWIASSKDHIISDPHRLKVYAIGMKMDGISLEYLRSKVHFYSNTSFAANHPNMSVSVPSNCLLIGGGAFDNYNGYGNMLVASYPSSSNTWYAEGKDHRRPDLSSITAYAIGIENVLFPNVGYLSVQAYSANRSFTQYGLQDINFDLPTGYAMTCVGGVSNYRDEGRMINRLYPASSIRAYLQSKDSYYNDSGGLTVWALTLKIL
jgi:hypothetical protein